MLTSGLATRLEVATFSARLHTMTWLGAPSGYLVALWKNCMQRPISTRWPVVEACQLYTVTLACGTFLVLNTSPISSMVSL